MDSYVVRVNFPDDDKYAFVKHECGMNEGQVKVFYNIDDAQKEASRFAGAIVIPAGNIDNDTFGNK